MNLDHVQQTTPRDICQQATDLADAIGWDWTLTVNRDRTEYSVTLHAPEDLKTISGPSSSLPGDNGPPDDAGRD